MSITFFTRCSVLLLASLLASLGLLTNCKKVCDNEDAPTYFLTQGESEWSKAFVKNDVWRFRNANGYVRTYRVSRAETLSQGGGGGKSSFCATYFVKYFIADLVREDSAAHPLEKNFRFQMGPANATTNKPVTANAFLWGSDFSLPIDQVEDGRLALGPATFGGRTYPAVLQGIYHTVSPPAPRPTNAKRVFFTKAEGLVRVEEFGGTVWNRL